MVTHSDAMESFQHLVLGLDWLCVCANCRRIKSWYDCVARAGLSKEQSKQLSLAVKEHFEASCYAHHIKILLPIFIYTS